MSKAKRFKPMKSVTIIDRDPKTKQINGCVVAIDFRASKSIPIIKRFDKYRLTFKGK